MLFYLSKVLFSGFLQFKAVFVAKIAQNTMVELTCFLSTAHFSALIFMCRITLLMDIVIHFLFTLCYLCTVASQKIKTKLALLVRWLCHGVLGDSDLSSLLFSASDRNFSEYLSRLSKYGYRAEINKNTSCLVTTSTGIVVTTAIKGGACVVTS